MPKRKRPNAPLPATDSIPPSISGWRPSGPRKPDLIDWCPARSHIAIGAQVDRTPLANTSPSPPRRGNSRIAPLFFQQPAFEASRGVIEATLRVPGQGQDPGSFAHAPQERPQNPPAFAIARGAATSGLLWPRFAAPVPG